MISKICVRGSLVGNSCAIGTHGITIFTICTNFFTNGTTGNYIGTNGTMFPMVPLENPEHAHTVFL